MKFTKEEAIEGLNSELIKKGEPLRMSDRSVKEMLNPLYQSFVNEETELDDFLKIAVSVFKPANANIRNDISLGIKEQLKALKEEEEDRARKPTQNKGAGVQNANQNQENPELKELLSKIKELETKVSKKEAETLISKKRSAIRSKLRESGITDKKVIDGYMTIANVSENTDEVQVASTLIETYNLSRGQSDSNPVGSSSGGRDIDYSTQFKSLKKAVEKT